MPIAEVAELLSYESVSSFNRTFKRICGVSPSMYVREENKKMP